MNSIHLKQNRKYRTIWISDVHLGYKGCNADYLLDFLHSTQCETLYLLGDIIDVWSMQRNMFWPQSHNNVIRTILGKAKHGTKVIYIPGNHDIQFREYHGMSFGNLTIINEAIHITADGKRLLLLHGDIFDSVMQCNRLTSFIGNIGYDFLLFINRHVHFLRSKFNFSYWSLSSYIKEKVTNAMKHIQHYENIVAKEAKRRGLDGVVCGHIHHAELREIDNIIYCNNGDWVEHCTALVEHHDGRLELLHWSDTQHVLKEQQAMSHKHPAETIKTAA